MHILTCRLWMPCQLWKSFIDTAVSWGHPAVAITDHANVQSFPHGYHRLRKLVLKLFWSWKPILLEDKVPIVYNSPEFGIKRSYFMLYLTLSK